MSGALIQKPEYLANLRSFMKEFNEIQEFSEENSEFMILLINLDDHQNVNIKKPGESEKATKLRESLEKILENWENWINNKGSFREKLIFSHFCLVFLENVKENYLDLTIRLFMALMKNNNEDFEKNKDIIIDFLMKINEKKDFLVKNLELLFDFLGIYRNQSFLLCFSNELFQTSRIFSIFLSQTLLNEKNLYYLQILEIILMFSSIKSNNLTCYIEKNQDFNEKISIIEQISNDLEKDLFLEKKQVFNAISCLLKVLIIAISQNIAKSYQIQGFLRFVFNLSTKKAVFNGNNEILVLLNQIIIEILVFIRKSENKPEFFNIFIKSLEQNPGLTLENLKISEFLETFHEILEKTLQNPDFLDKNLSFLSFLLRNLNNLQPRIQLFELLKQIFRKSEVFLKYLENPLFLDNFFEFTLNPDAIEVFMHFLDFFYRIVLLEPDIEPFYRTAFLQHLDKFLKTFYEEKEDFEVFEQKVLVFFTVFLKIVIFQRKSEWTFIEIFQNPEKALSLESLFIHKVI